MHADVHSGWTEGTNMKMTVVICGDCCCLPLVWGSVVDPGKIWTHLYGGAGRTLRGD